MSNQPTTFQRILALIAFGFSAYITIWAVSNGYSWEGLFLGIVGGIILICYFLEPIDPFNK